MEFIEEGWTKFKRFRCKEGFIDKWTGDMADSPNRDKKSPIHLNSFTSYYRLNGDNGWFHKESFMPEIQQDILQLRLDFTAYEIWMSNLR